MVEDQLQECEQIRTYLDEWVQDAVQEHDEHFRLLERFIHELERPGHVEDAAHHFRKFRMEDLAQPFLSLFEVSVEEASEQREVLVDVPAGHGESDATGDEAYHSNCMAHPWCVIARILGQHNSPAGQ